MTIAEYDSYIIKPCGTEDIANAMDFFGREWSESHFLAERKDYVDYFFYNEGRRNYNIIISVDKETSDVIGMLTYVPNTRFDPQITGNDSFIWLCNWLATGDKGMGLSLYSGLVMYENAKNLGTVGCNERAGLLYKAMRYKTGGLKHFFLVNDSIQDFGILSGYKPDKTVQTGQSSNACVHLTRLDVKPDESVLSAELVNYTENAKPKKTLEYIWNKYAKNFYRDYYIYGICADGDISGLFVVRTACHKDCYALRIVDFLGDAKNLSGLYEQLQILCKSFGAEYIDLYCTGIPEGFLFSSGFELVKNDSGITVPDYFEPFLNENINIRYAYRFEGVKTDNENFYIFRGDCDREHPGRIHER